MRIIQEVDYRFEPVMPADHIRGDPSAPVILIEYGEFECPYCGRAYHPIKRLVEKADGRIRFVFRHFARDDVHPFSERSAQAAEAAAAQGQFWEMHDFLFEHQHQLEYQDLVRHALEVGLDAGRFNQELSSGTYLPRVQSDLSSGLAAGVTETPTLFINGVKYTGEFTTDGLLAAVAAADHRTS